MNACRPLKRRRAPTAFSSAESKPGIVERIVNQPMRAIRAAGSNAGDGGLWEVLGDAI